ncbi:MAG: translocation/assembly module TamB domain-containing protein [Terriglobales bacterium]
MTARTKLPSRRLWKYALLLVALSAAVVGVLAWYATTNSFQAMVRNRLVNQLQRITGGRVEVGGVHTVPFKFQIEVRNLTIHGRERDTAIPYAHVDQLMVHLKLTSLLTSGLTFRSVVLEHPVIHIIFYPDGSTNQPAPERVMRSGNKALENLFALSITELEVRRGELFWNDQRIPLDFTASDVFADMNYSLLHRRYETSLLLGKATTRYGNFTPVSWTASAHLRLAENSIEVQSLRMTSGRSRIQAAGTLINFIHPTVNATYDAVFDLNEVRAIAHIPEIRGGVIEASGKGAWSTTDFSLIGKLEAKDLSFRNGSLTLRDATFKSGYSVDPQRILLPDIAGNILGGAVAGSAEITDWQTLQSSPRKSKMGGELDRESRVRLELRDISASEAAKAISTARRPFSKMNIVGDVTGTVNATWYRSPANAVADIVFDVVAPAKLRPGQLAVNGHARTTYRRATQELVVSEFTASTKATQIKASGTLSSSATVNLSVSTSNLGEWQPILVAVGYDQPVPVRLLGPASFNGMATGHLSSITFSGKLQSGNFDFIVPATSRTPEEDVHWDSFVTDMRLSPAGLALRNSELRRNSTAIHFDINLGLEDRHFTPTSPFTARIDMQHANLGELMEMAGYRYPASGMMDLSVQLAGTRSDPEGNGQIHISDAVIYGQPVQQVSSTLSFNRHELVLHNLEMAQLQTRVMGDASYDFSARSFSLDLSGSHFDLARISKLRSSRVSVQGTLDFVARGSGTIENPDIKAQIHLRNLTVDQELAGDFTLNAVSQGPEIYLSGVSQFKTAELGLKGTVRPSGDWPASLDLHFARLDIDPVLLAYLRGHVTGHSSVAGDLHMEGPLRRPSKLNLAGNLTDLSADIEHVKLHNEGPVQFAIANHLLKVSHFHLLGDDTDLSGEGSVNLSGGRELDFRARGQLNLQLIRSYNPDFTESGTVNVDMSVTGTASNPLAQGRMQITNGSVAYADSPSALSGINGSLLFNQGQFQIEKLTGHVGGGTVAFQGQANWSNRVLNFDLGLHGQEVRLRYPQGVSSTANLDLQLSGSSVASTLTGDITVTKVAVTPGFDFGAYLQRTAQSSAISQTNPVLNRVRLDIHIVTVPELQMQTAVIRLSGDADLHLRGTAAKSVLLGRADVLEGQAYFNGTKYRLERGDVTFTNPVTTVPVVDLQASTRVRDYDLTLNLNGPADKLNLTYRSEPPLPTSDIIALLAFGQTTQQSAQLQQSGAPSVSQAASNAILAAALNTAVNNRAQRLFGVSRIKIDPQGLNTETSPTQSGPAITIEQQVASNITVSYSTNVAQTSQQVIQAEYNVTRNISIVAIRDENGVVSFDVKIRRRKK